MRRSLPNRGSPSLIDQVPWPGDVHAVAARLRAGEVAAVPAEGLLLAHGLSGIERLPKQLLSVGLASPHELFDWSPSVRGVALRLVRDFWPGPLVLVVNPTGGLASRLPEESRKRLIVDDSVALRLLPEPLSTLPPAMDGPLIVGETCEDLTPDFELAFKSADVSPPATMVSANERSYLLLRAGAITPGELEESRRAKIVLVCTGNTCRSPMAEVLCRRLLADTLGDVESERGFEIQSAGLAADPRQPASPEAIEVARERGADLTGHSSQPLTLEMVDRADLLFTMTAGHLRMLKSLRLPVGPEPELLSAWGQDVPDPIGGPRELYEECAEQIWQCLRERLPRILES